MSLKSYIRLISVIRYTNGHSILSNARCVFKFKNKNSAASASVQFLNSVRLSSTQEKTITDQNNRLIYTGILSGQIRAVKLFSLLTSLTGVAVQPSLLKNVIPDASVPAIVGIYAFVGFFTFVTPLLLHFITKKYVTELRYNPETKTYEATVYNLFITKTKIEFKPEDVHVPEVAGLFTTFQVKGKSLFVEPRLFVDPTHYGKIMGYDKPIDFKLFETSLNEKKK